MIANNQASALDTINKFLKVEFQEGLRSEMNEMEALINIMKKEQLTGKYKEISFGMGIVDNMRAMGQLWTDNTDKKFLEEATSNDTDKYELGISDYEVNTGVEQVTAKFDVTKFLATFALTDEAVLIGTGAGTLFDYVKDSLDRMTKGLKHRQSRMVYGGKDGILGAVTTDVTPVKSFVRNGKGALKFSMENIHTVVEGSQLMIKAANGDRILGKVWQKVHRTVSGAPSIIVLVDKVIVGGTPTTEFTSGNVASAIPTPNATWSVYSRQFRDEEGVEREYQGLEDILFGNSSNMFGIDFDVYEGLRPTLEDAGNALIDEYDLDQMRDHIATTHNSSTDVDLVCANHKIISAIKSQFYGNKQYDMDNGSNEFKLGRQDIRYDNFVFRKDKFARAKKIYMLDTKQIGELQRRDLAWLTSGPQQGVLERRDGTEIYEGIMTKYADLYVDAFRAHAGYFNVAETNNG